MKLTPTLRKLPWTISAGSLLIIASTGLGAQQAQQDQQQAQQQQPQQEQAQQPSPQQQSPQQQQAQQEEGPTVFVEQQPPQVQVQQPRTQVTAQQKKMDVEVRTGEPQVSVQQPEPQVSVQQQEPEVTVQQAEPQVIVEDAQPQVEVNQAEPEVTVNRAEPEILVISEDRSGRRTEQRIQAMEQGAQSQQQQAQQQARDLMRMELSQLRDMNVQTSQGEDLGSVNDIVVNQSSGSAGFVVSTGGVLGIGAQDVFVPANEAQVYQDRIVWQTNQSPEQIEQSAQYQAEQFVSVADAQGTLEQARTAVTQRAQR